MAFSDRQPTAEAGLIDGTQSVPPTLAKRFGTTINRSGRPGSLVHRPSYGHIQLIPSARLRQSRYQAMAVMGPPAIHRGSFRTLALVRSVRPVATMVAAGAAVATWANVAGRVVALTRAGNKGRGGRLLCVALRVTARHSAFPVTL
jgi:hypothetical protein